MCYFQIRHRYGLREADEAAVERRKWIAIAVGDRRIRRGIGLNPEPVPGMDGPELSQIKNYKGEKWFGKNHFFETKNNFIR